MGLKGSEPLKNLSGLNGAARIGRVYFSKSGKTHYYKGMQFQSLKGSGFKANYFEVESGDHYWMSGPRKDQGITGDRPRL